MKRGSEARRNETPPRRKRLARITAPRENSIQGRIDLGLTIRTKRVAIDLGHKGAPAVALRVQERIASSWPAHQHATPRLHAAPRSTMERDSARRLASATLALTSERSHGRTPGDASASRFAASRPAD